MNGTTHMTIGGLTGGLILAQTMASNTLSLNFSGYEIYPLIVTVAAAIGGLAPDVDIAHSKAGRFLRSGLRMTLAASAIFLLAMVFMPQTGIAFLDGAVARGAEVNRGVPLVLAAFCGLIMLIIEKSKHRGFTHTIVGLLLVASPLLFMLITGVMFVGADIAVSAQIGFVLGWLSHMVADTFNRGGVPWLWPVLKKRFRVMRIRTGSGMESKFAVVCTLLFILCYAAIITGAIIVRL